MKNINKHLTYLLLSILAAAFLLSSCSSEKDTSIVTINKNKLYMEDFLYDIYFIEKDGNQLEDYYQEKLGYSYWDFEYNNTTVREAAKSSVLTNVVMYEILSDQAKKNGIQLSQEEISVSDKAVQDILNSSSVEELNHVGLTYDVLKEASEKRALGDKYRKELSMNFKIDEDAIKKNMNPEDYREYKTECVFVPTVITKNKTLSQLKEEEKASAYKEMLEAREMFAEGKSIDSVKIAFPGLISDTRDFIETDSSYEEEYMAAAITLQNNDFSQIISTKYGYYIIHMLDNNSSGRYERAVKDAIKSEEDSQFAQAYNEMKAQYDITVNFDIWDSVTIGQITEPKNTP